MLPQDCIVETGKDGKKARFVISETGQRYQLGKKLGDGGVGSVYLVIAADGPQKGQKFVLREYRSPNGNLTISAQQRSIRRNLEHLIETPVTDDDGKPLPSLVKPLDMIAFPLTDSFGCIMNYVELKDFVSVGKMRKSFPPADILCKLCYEVSHFFARLASASGLCCNDINEGNIYLNPQTGDVRIIDNDNIVPPGAPALAYNSFYMPPEVVMGEGAADMYTSRFQLAAYLFRLFLGGFPYDGPRAARYISEHGLTITSAKDIIIGSDATFIFDPDDRSNAIHSALLPDNATPEEKAQHNSWMHQAETWDRLPPVLQENFIRTFSRGCSPENRQNRTTAQKWQKTFLDLQQSIVTCPQCGQTTFGTGPRCFFCGETLQTVSCKHCGGATPTLHPVCIHCSKPLDSVADPAGQPPCQEDHLSPEQRCTL